MRESAQMINAFLRGMALAGALTLSAGAATAASDVTIQADQAKIIAVSGQPGTVVVGNPSIADVSVQGDQVVLVGRNYGVTNVIILDREGRQLAALDVMVRITDKNALHVYRSAKRMSMACDPVCEQTLQVGDDLGTVFEPLAKEIQMKGDIANGPAKAE